MKFAKVVFWGAAIWGILVLTPMYFLYEKVGESYPPPLTHPEFYFGFAGVGLACQFVFAVIATDPGRYRLLMLPSIFEKASYVVAVAVLYLQHRTTLPLLGAGVDALLGLLFVIAFLKTRPAPALRTAT
jgi:hypothetical protein